MTTIRCNFLQNRIHNKKITPLVSSPFVHRRSDTNSQRFLTVMKKTKKRLDTRFPAARIKKIIQSNDDVGKIAKAVPLIVSKALELFLQDLCDCLYDVMTNQGAKMVTSFHLKLCVLSFHMFDFLNDTVMQVPDLGEFTVTSDDRLVGRKRKLADFGDENVISQTDAVVKRRGRRNKHKQDKFEDDPDMNDFSPLKEDYKPNTPEITDKSTNIETKSSSVRNFDLNLDLDENGDPASDSSAESNVTEEESVKETVHDEHSSILSGEGEIIENDPIMFSVLNHGAEDDENYDLE